MKYLYLCNVTSPLYTGKNFVLVSKTEEVGVISETMIVRLLEEKCGDSSKTILRFRTFVTWLSVNSMNAVVKEEVLETLNFEDFSFKDLSSDVRKSGLYSMGQIMERMEELHQVQSKEFKEEVKKLKEEKIEKEKSVRDDMMIVKKSVNRRSNLGGSYDYDYWCYVPRDLKTKYNVF